MPGDDGGRGLVLAGRDEEPRQRAHGVVARRELDDAPVERDGLGGVAEDLFFERGPLLEHVGALVANDLLAAQLEEPAQIVLALVGAEERVEGGDGLGVAGVGLDQLAVGGHRLVELGELAGVDLGELEAEAALLGAQPGPWPLFSRASTASTKGLHEPAPRDHDSSSSRPSASGASS